MAPIADPMGSATAERGHFVADTKASRFTVQAFATGILSAMGHNPTLGISKFACAVDFNADSVLGRDFEMVIEAASLSVLDDISAKDRGEMERLVREEVLEVSRYPEIQYRASDLSVQRIDGEMYKAELHGSLVCHGVTRALPVSARILLVGEGIRASGGFNLRQSDFKIKPVSVAGGALKLKDELKFSFEIVLRRQEDKVSAG